MFCFSLSKSVKSKYFTMFLSGFCEIFSGKSQDFFSISVSRFFLRQKILSGSLPGFFDKFFAAGCLFSKNMVQWLASGPAQQPLDKLFDVVQLKILFRENGSVSIQIFLKAGIAVLICLVQRICDFRIPALHMPAVSIVVPIRTHILLEAAYAEGF